jgi:GH25 family lysozyme M1 (1,4-beta-N-acetylmuramidase)
MRPTGFLVLVTLSACSSEPRIGVLEQGLSVCAKGTVTKGIDVSHYDGTIAWPSVKAGGIEFAIMKATENTNFVDPQFATNWKGAGDNGVLRGAYHFFRASVDAVQQADYFLKTSGPASPGDLPPTLDLETLDGVPAAQVGTGALAFLAHVAQKTGRKPIVYTSASFLSSIGNPSGFDAYTLWVANWQVTCPKIPSPVWSDWTIWQNASTGTVAGINGMVDLDEFNGTLADLQMFANAGANPAGTDAGGSPAGDGGSTASGSDGGDATGSDGATGTSDDASGSGPPSDTHGMQGGCSTVPGASAPAPLLVFLLLPWSARWFRGPRRGRRARL